jgi:type IV secretory pathway VirB2 component (pilin)
MSPLLRRTLSSVLLVLACLVAVVAVLGAWANRQLLDTDNWVDTSSHLLQEPAIQNATAAYLADQLVDGPTIQVKLKDGLPPRLQPLAAPLAAASGEIAERTARRLIASGAFQRLWRETNRRAHRQFIDIVDGNTRLANAGIVVDLRPQLGVLATRLGVLPDATGDHGTVHVLKGDNLKTTREIVHAARTLRWVSVVLLIVLLVAGVALAPDRARGILYAGVALLIAGLLLLVARRAGGNYVVDTLADSGTDEPAARATWSIATSLLRDIAGALVVLGVVDIAAGWLAGGTSWARSARRFAAPALTAHGGLVYAGVLVLVLVLIAAGLLPAAGQLWAIVFYALLAAAGVWALRRQVIREAEGLPPVAPPVAAVP